MNLLKGRPQMAGRPATDYPWRAPPPNIYYLKNLLGFVDHDVTKKLAPAYSLVRYVYPPKPKIKVSTAPFIKALRRQHKKQKGDLISRTSKNKKKKKKKQKQNLGRSTFRRREDLSNKDILEQVEEEEPPEIEVFETLPPFKPPPLKYKLTRRTSSVSDLFMTPTGNVKCKSCNVWNYEDKPEDIWNDPRFKNKKIHGIQYLGVALQADKFREKSSSYVSAKKKKRCKKKSMCCYNNVSCCYGNY